LFDAEYFWQDIKIESLASLHFFFNCNQFFLKNFRKFIIGRKAAKLFINIFERQSFMNNRLVTFSGKVMLVPAIP